MSSFFWSWARVRPDSMQVSERTRREGGRGSVLFSLRIVTREKRAAREINETV
jgi:hypothetical protein